MAQIDHNIVFQGAGGHYLSPEAAQSHQVSIAEAAQRGRINKQVEEQNAIKLKEQQDEAQFGKDLDKYLVDRYKAADARKAAVNETVKVEREAAGIAADPPPLPGVNADNPDRPTLAQPEEIQDSAQGGGVSVAGAAKPRLPNTDPGMAIGPDRIRDTDPGLQLDPRRMPSGQSPVAPTPVSPQPAQAPPPQRPSAPKEDAHPVDWVTSFVEEQTRKGQGSRAMRMQQAMEKHLLETRKEVAATSKAETEAKIARYGLLDNAVSAFVDAGKSEVVARNEWPSFIANQIRSGNLTSAEAEPFREYPGRDGMKKLHTLLGAEKKVTEHALKLEELRKSKAEADAATSPAAKAEAQAKSDKAVADQAWAVREMDHSKLADAAQQGLPALIAAYDALPENRRPALNPHEIDPKAYDTDATVSNLVFAGLKAPQKQAAIHAREQLEIAGSAAKLAQRANDPKLPKAERDAARAAMKDLNNLAIQRAVATAQAAQAAAMGGFTMPGAPAPVAGPKQGDIQQYGGADYVFNGTEWVAK